MDVTLALLLKVREEERERSKSVLVQGRLPAVEHRTALEILRRNGLSWTDLIQLAARQLIADQGMGGAKGANDTGAEEG